MQDLQPSPEQMQDAELHSSERLVAMTLQGMRLFPSQDAGTGSSERVHSQQVAGTEVIIVSAQTSKRKYAQLR